MLFKGFFGNASVKEQLTNALQSGRMPHAVLIDGPQGSGKRTLARIIAAAAVCESTTERPCGICRQCINAFADNHADIMSYSGEKARSFSVDTVRKIRSEAYISPNDADIKVYILIGIHNMTEQAQNALLKIIEEPPAHVMFVMTCEGRSRVLSTVQSRCALVTLGSVSEEEAVTALLADVPLIERDKALQAAALSGYIIGRAKKGLEEGSYSEAATLADAFSKALCGATEYDFIKLSGKFEKGSSLFAAFLELLPQLFRDALCAKNGVSSRLSGCGEEALKLSRNLTQRQLYTLISTSLSARAALDRNANATLLATALFSNMWQDAHGAIN
jgi:hypothetical protein